MFQPNCTPMRFALRQATRQGRRTLPSPMMRSNASGMPSWLASSRQAPPADKFLIVQLMVLFPFGSTILPLLSVRSRASFLSSGT